MFGKGRGKRGKGKAPEPKKAAPSWSIRGGAADIIINSGPPSKKPRKGAAKGSVPAVKDIVDNELEKNEASNEQIGEIARFLRDSKVEKAAEVLRTQLGDATKNNSISVKQYGRFIESFGLRIPKEQALEFLDIVDALGLPKFPSFGAQAYFGRFCRWNLREFLAESVSAIERAQSMQAQTLERQGSCVTAMEASPSDKGNSYLMLTPVLGRLPDGHGFQRGDYLLVTFPPSGTPGIEMNQFGDMSLEAELAGTTFPPAPQGLIVKLPGDLGQHAGEKFNKQKCRVDRIANHVTADRQLSALVALCSATDKKEEQQPKPPEKGEKGKGKKKRQGQKGGPSCQLASLA